MPRIELPAPSCAALRAGLEACRDLFLLGGREPGIGEKGPGRRASESPWLAGLGSPWGRRKLCGALKEDNSPPPLGVLPEEGGVLPAGDLPVCLFPFEESLTQGTPCEGTEGWLGGVKGF